MSIETRSSSRGFKSFAGFGSALLFTVIGAANSPAQTTIIHYTNEWKYLQATSAPVAWNTSTFDDSSWLAGRGTLAVPATEALPAGPVFNTLLNTNVGEGYVFTHHFRTRVNLPSPTNLNITGSAAIDDGAVIYVNGREARRIGMPMTGTISYNTPANRGGEVGSRTLDAFTLASSHFVEGENLIAVEVHQDVANSADTVFAMQLDIEILDPPAITIQPSDQTVPEGSRGRFFVGATGTRLRYQWYQNNVTIAGATNALYETSPATLAVNGRTFHVVVSNAVTAVRSDPARLTVVADTFGPGVRTITQDGTNLHRLIVHYDEPVLRLTATNHANYSLHVLGTTNTIAITNANYAIDRIRLWLSDSLNPSVGYLLCIANVHDTKTNLIVPSPTCAPVLFPSTSNAVSMGEVWRFNDVELGPLPPNWVTLNYNDDPNTPPYHWAESSAAFARSHNTGFDPCSPIQTSLSLGPVTYYFRKRFFSPREYPSTAVFTLRHMVDDGAVFYLNGREIYRVNMPAGPVEYNTRASVSINNALCVEVALEGVRPVVGTNILAVEVHQSLETIVDVVFDTEANIDFLRAPELPRLHSVVAGSETAIAWDGDGWRLQSATNISGPWSSVAANTNRFVVPPAPAHEQKFFRLVTP